MDTKLRRFSFRFSLRLLRLLRLLLSPAETFHSGESLPELPQLEVVPLDRAKNLWHSEPIHREIHR